MSTYTRDGIDRAAKQIHESNRKAGKTESFEDTRKRVERAVTRQERRRSDKGL